MITGLQPAELPHSEMSGSKVVCTYPNLIAAYHVLHRLLEPRHPPFALSFFFYNVKLFVTISRFRLLEIKKLSPIFFYIVNYFFLLVDDLDILIRFQTSVTNHRFYIANTSKINSMYHLVIYHVPIG